MAPMPAVHGVVLDREHLARSAGERCRAWRPRRNGLQVAAVVDVGARCPRARTPGPPRPARPGPTPMPCAASVRSSPSRSRGHVPRGMSGTVVVNRVDRLGDPDVDRALAVPPWTASARGTDVLVGGGDHHGVVANCPRDRDVLDGVVGWCRSSPWPGRTAARRGGPAGGCSRRRCATAQPSSACRTATWRRCTASYPQAARPAATETELVSAMPSSMYLSGTPRGTRPAYWTGPRSWSATRSSAAAISVTA